MDQRTEAKLPANNRDCYRTPEKQIKIGMYLDVETAEKVRRIAAAADMALGRVVSELLYFALERITAEQKGRSAWEKCGPWRPLSVKPAPSVSHKKNETHT